MDTVQTAESTNDVQVIVSEQHQQDESLENSSLSVSKSTSGEEISAITQQQSDDNSTPAKCDTTNFSDYQRVWILICLDRARSVLGLDSQSKINSQLHRVTCEMLHVERERSHIHRKPTIKSLKNIWTTFIEHQQISRQKRGGPKPKQCREEVETLLKQNLSFRQIVKRLKPEINISTTTVGRIADDLKREQVKRQKALQKEKRQMQSITLDFQESQG